MPETAPFQPARPPGSTTHLGVSRFVVARLLAVSLCGLIALCSLACDRAKKLAQESKEGLQIVEQVGSQLGELYTLISANDFAQAKALGAKLDRFLDTRVLSWCIQALAIEEAKGAPVALAWVKEVKDREGISADELKVLEMLERHFVAQGKGRTGDLLLLIGAIAVEKKFGHGAGGLLLAFREKVSPGGKVPMTNVSPGN
ncbi:MAG TPA: hypothetical protein PLX89_17110 [Verrucomicrobiota bacterium]|nr:hypothetical protein [Verrucomicrobiales bacterium]HRI14717.1 hypothetical protein [Verrucomicrobiota bacterium]